jgi:hypothetical protein
MIHDIFLTFVFNNNWLGPTGTRKKKKEDKHTVGSPAYVNLRTFYSATNIRKRGLTNQLITNLCKEHSLMLCSQKAITRASLALCGAAIAVVGFLAPASTDGGSTWLPLTQGLPADKPGANLGRVGIAVVTSGGQVMSATAASNNGTTR